MREIKNQTILNPDIRVRARACLRWQGKQAKLISGSNVQMTKTECLDHSYFEHWCLLFSFPYYSFFSKMADQSSIPD